MEQDRRATHGSRLKCFVFLGEGAVAGEPEGSRGGSYRFFVADITDQGAAATNLVTAKRYTTLSRMEMSAPGRFKISGKPAKETEIPVRARFRFSLADPL